MQAFWAIMTSVIVASALGRFLFKWILVDYGDLWDFVAKICTPNISSLFSGEFFEDTKQSFKLWIFLFLTGGSAWVSYDYVDGFGKKGELVGEDLSPTLESDEE